MADVQVTIGASLKELYAGLNTAGEKLGDLRKHSMQTEGAVRFFERALGDVGSTASKTAGIAANMLGAFATGGAMGLAIGGVHALMGVMKEMHEEQKEAFRITSEGLAQLADKAKAAADEFDRLRLSKLGLSPEVIEGAKAYNEALRTEETAKQKLAVAQREYNDAQEEFDPETAANIGQKFVKSDVERLAALEKLNLAEQELEAAQANRTAVQGKASITGSEGVRKQEGDAKNAKIAILDANLERQKALGISEEEAENLRYRIDLEKARLALLKANTDIEKQAANAQLAAANATHQDNLIKARFKVAKAVHDQELANQRNADEIEDAAEEVRVANKKKELDKEAGLYVAFGERAGAALGNAFSKGMTPLKAASSILKEVGSAVIQQAMKSVAAYAAETAAGAASSQAGIPVVGPFLAAGAMTAALAMVMGLMSNIPSAAGGWETPSFGTAFPAVLHPNEMVIPSWGKRALRNMAELDAGTGSAVVVNVTSPDAKSMERMFRDYSSDVRKALRTDMRRRRNS